MNSIVSAMTAGWGKPRTNQSITQKPLGIGGTKFERGVGTHAESECVIALDGKAKSFRREGRAWMTTRTASGPPSSSSCSAMAANFGAAASADGKQPARECRVDLAGVKLLELVVTDAGDGIELRSRGLGGGQHSSLTARAASREAREPVKEEFIALTPPAPPEPRLNGPRVYGVRPGSPFLYRIPATGERPMQFRAEGSAGGTRRWIRRAGIITGRLAKAGTNIA